MTVANAAIQSGIPRYFPWQFGVDFDAIGRGGPHDLFEAQLDARDLLRSQDTLERVIISTGMFTSFLFEPDFGVVDLENHAVHALGSMDNAVTLTTPEDIGALTAQIVFFEPRIRNEIVCLAGDTVTYGEFHQVLEKVFGRTFESTAWSVPSLMEELALDPQNTITKYRAAFAQGKGVLAEGRDVQQPPRTASGQPRGLDERQPCQVMLETRSAACWKQALSIARSREFPQL